VQLGGLALVSTGFFLLALWLGFLVTGGPWAVRPLSVLVGGAHTEGVVKEASSCMSA
jgi:hypothetical protein